MTQSPLRLLGAPSGTTEELIAELGQPAYRAAQITEWIYRHHVTEWDAMTNLPAALRRDLAARAEVTDTVVDETFTSSDGTVKRLVRLTDGARVECVMIPDGERRTACISSQVGCAVGCIFCASGMGGGGRSLRPDEILAQYALINRSLAPLKLTNVVFMGMGEPLLNLSAVLTSLRCLNAPDRFALGARRITVSTVGITGAIGKLATCGLQFGLALSLHAPTEELRRRLVPYPSRASLEEILDAAAAYHGATNRIVTVEYVMLGGENDAPEHAKALARLCKPRRFKVNLIPWNAVAELQPLRPSPRTTVEAFRDRLVAAGVTCTIRRQRGDDIAAACGQLAGKVESAP